MSQWTSPAFITAIAARADVRLDSASLVAVTLLGAYGAQRPSDLAARLSTGASNISKIAARLQDAGLLERLVDPADARAALLSKRVVRELIQTRRAEAMAVCICGAGDDGREQVQCDDCSRWYHLQCLGIGSAEELGDEDDEWFCYACIDDGRGRTTPSSRG